MLYLRKDETNLNDELQLKLLFTSDIHGNVLPLIYGTNEHAELGLAKYATIVQQTRKKHEHVLVIDNGDLIQGTPLMAHYAKMHLSKANPMIEIMNQLQLDAFVPGNHEFNFGKDILLGAVNTSEFPWLSANILTNNQSETYFGKPYLIKTLANDLKVAIIGATTHYIPHWEAPEHIADFYFADAFDTLATLVPHIKKTERPDILIVAYHGGFEKDLATGEATGPLTGENQGYKIASEIDGIDLLLTGHQHRILNDTIDNCLIIQPGSALKAYGDIELTVKKNQDDTWQLTHKKAEIKDLIDVPADGKVHTTITPLEKSTQAWLDQTIGHVVSDLTISDPMQVRLEKHPFIELIQQIQMEATGADISATALLNNESTGFGKTVTMRDIAGNYIFPNTLVVLELTGRDIKDALELNASYFIINEKNGVTVNPAFTTPKPEHYNYDMWEGINYRFNLQKSFGERVEAVSYHGKPLVDEATYHVALNNYRASGGGNFTMFTNKPIVKEVQIDMVELISAYIEAHSPVEVNVTKNFTITY